MLANIGSGSFGIGGFGSDFTLSVIVILVWSIFWKGMALWKAAHEESKPWFIALLVINTVGILEILYLYVFSKKDSMPAAPMEPKI